MSNEYINERTYVFVDSLESGEYLFKTEYGSLITESMLKEQLLAQFENARRRLDKPSGKHQLCVTMKVSGEA